MPEQGSDVPETESILGHSGREIRRLIRQAAILRPIAERLPRGAGIGRGMRVLDLTMTDPGAPAPRDPPTWRPQQAPGRCREKRII